jgi:hypothetical protein
MNSGTGHNHGSRGKLSKLGNYESVATIHVLVGLATKVSMIRVVIKIIVNHLLFVSDFILTGISSTGFSRTPHTKFYENSSGAERVGT